MCGLHELLLTRRSRGSGGRGGRGCGRGSGGREGRDVTCVDLLCRSGIRPGTAGDVRIQGFLRLQTLDQAFDRYGFDDRRGSRPRNGNPGRSHQIIRFGFHEWLRELKSRKGRALLNWLNQFGSNDHCGGQMVADGSLREKFGREEEEAINDASPRRVSIIRLILWQEEVRRLRLLWRRFALK